MVADTKFKGDIGEEVRLEAIHLLLDPDTHIFHRGGDQTSDSLEGFNVPLV